MSVAGVNGHGLILLLNMDDHGEIFAMFKH